MPATTRRRIVVDDSALAARIGARIREARKRAGLTQQQLAEGRYTKAYVSALEKGLAKPSMAALNFFSDRLGVPASRLIADEAPAWTRLQADLLLASERWQDAADAYEALLETTPDPRLRAEMLRGRAEALYRLDRPSEALAPAAEAVELFTKLGRRVDAAWATYWLAAAHHLRHNEDEARSLLESLLDQVRGGLKVAPDFKLRLLLAIALTLHGKGEYRRALDYLEEARGLIGDLDTRRRAAFYGSLAFDYQEIGDYEAAIRNGIASLTLFRAAEAEREVAGAENSLALAYLGLGNLDRAREYIKRGRERLSALDSGHTLAHLVETEAQIALAAGAPDEALALAKESIELAEQHGNRRALLSAHLSLARAHVAAGDLDAGERAYENAAELARAEAPARLAEVLGDWADLVARLGQHDRAYALTREALKAGRG